MAYNIYTASMFYSADYLCERALKVRLRLLHFWCFCTRATSKGTLSTTAKWLGYLGLGTSGSLQHNVHSCTLLGGRLGINAEVLNLHFFLKVQVWLLDALKNQSTEGHQVGWIREVRLWCSKWASLPREKVHWKWHTVLRMSSGTESS